MKSCKRSSSYSQETKKIRKIINEEIKLGIQPSSASETEEVDLHKELHPLGYYINDKEDMIEQMFSMIKGEKLMKMLPPILKDMPLDELKADCLIHLLGMSKKRIFAILEGREINSSSGSETDAASSPIRGRRKATVVKQEGCSDISENSEEVILIDPDVEHYQPPARKKDRQLFAGGSGNTRTGHSQGIISKHKKTVHKRTKAITIEHLDLEKDKSEEYRESSPGSIDSNQDNPAMEGKTLLDILELEMRARAIKALLNKNESPEIEEVNENGEELQSSSKDDTPVVEKPVSEQEKSVKKLRKKKRKNDDVIVITPKVITIDLTDENDFCTTRKKTKETAVGKKCIENIDSRISENTHKKDEMAGREKIKSSDIIDVDNLSTATDKQTNDTKNPVLGALKRYVQSSGHTNNETLEKSMQQKRDWAQRWLESKEVKQVVSTSKICGNIRKRIKIAKLAKQSQALGKKVETSQEIQGSVDEYQMLPKLNTPLNAGDNQLDGRSNDQTLTLLVNDDQLKNQNDAESGEQVQDISSTRVESPMYKKCCKENVSDYDSPSNLTRQNDSLNSQISRSKCIEDATLQCSNSLDSKFGEDTDLKDVQSDNCVFNNNNNNDFSERHSGAKFDKLRSTDTDLDSCPNSKIEQKSMVKLDSDESKSVVTSQQEDLSKSKQSEMKNPHPNNESEALEININDEDIVGIFDVNTC